MLFLRLKTHYYSDSTNKCVTRITYHRFRTLIDLNSFMLSLESNKDKYQKEFTFEFTQTSPLAHGEWSELDPMHSTDYNHYEVYGK